MRCSPQGCPLASRHKLTLSLAVGGASNFDRGDYNKNPPLPVGSLLFIISYSLRRQGHSRAPSSYHPHHYSSCHYINPHRVLCHLIPSIVVIISSFGHFHFRPFRRSVTFSFARAAARSLSLSSCHGVFPTVTSRLYKRRRGSPRGQFTDRTRLSHIGLSSSRLWTYICAVISSQSV